MFITILNWLYILVISAGLGHIFSWFCEKVFSYKLQKAENILMAGLVIATVYAQIFSLFGGVGLCANIILFTVCLTGFFFLRKNIVSAAKKCISDTPMLKKIVIFGLFMLWAYFTSRGYFHYDSDLYHGQSIRWIEEYGVIKGLGNLHVRLAYNSSSFALSALFSWKFLIGQSLHTISGFFAFLLSLTTLKIADGFKRRKLYWADYARLAAIYYLTLITDEVVSPASDYVIMCVLFFIVIKWLDLLQKSKKEQKIAPYALLCVLGVYAVSLKLTAGLILILVIKPAAMLIKEKKYKEIALYIAMGILVIAPWLIRTVIISGWLLYPFPAIDLFDVDWKIPVEIAARDAAEIKTWGRALYNANLVNEPITEWFANWFSTTLSATNKLFVLADFLCIPVVGAIAVLSAVKRKRENADALLVLLTVLCSYLFWQFSAPLIRYGYVYVLLLVALTAGWFLEKMRLDKILCVFILMFGIYKGWMIAGDIADTSYMSYYFWQQDYGIYEVRTYEIDGVEFYYPVSGDRVGYEHFPSSPVVKDIELRGEGIEDGFKIS